MIKLGNEQDFEKIIQSNEKVIIDFSATWCGPCQMQKVVLESMETKHPEIKIVSIDVDEFPRIAAKFNISSIPTIHSYKNGKLIKERIGYTDEETLLKF